MKSFRENYTNNPIRTRVYKELESAIISGDVAPGTTLNEVKLSAEMGVSRTPIREAIMQLEHAGLVETIPNRGAVVVGVTRNDIYDIYMIRTRIEGLAARRMAESATDEEIASLKEVVELQEFYLAKKDNLQVCQLDSRFHEMLYYSCRSRPLRQMLTLFLTHIRKPREISVKSGRAADSTREHRKIVEAIEKHDPDLAERMMDEHVTNARDYMLAWLK